jgi:hypothetical protein
MGRKDVSMLDYRTDGGQCAVLAASGNPNTDPTKQAGSTTAANGAGRTIQDSPSPSPGQPGSNATPGAGTNSVTGGTYRDSASADFVNRAAMQQRTQEMAAQRVRNEALKSCLSGRGYTEFQLTAEQRAELDKLPQGSDARREYLYKLGTNPDVLTKQAVSSK